MQVQRLLLFLGMLAGHMAGWRICGGYIGELGMTSGTPGCCSDDIILDMGLQDVAGSWGTCSTGQLVFSLLELDSSLTALLPCCAAELSIAPSMYHA